MLVYHSLGSGKTFTALAAARYNFHLKLIVLSYPKLVIKNFLAEYKEFKCLFPHTTPEINSVMLMSLIKLSEDFVRDYLRDSFIIIDESHLVRNKESSKSYRMLYKILQELWQERSIKVMMLTGTPITDSIQDFHDTMGLLGVKDGEEDKNISYLKNDLCEIEYMGETIDGFGWNIDTVPLPDDFVGLYKSSVESCGSFYTKVIDVVLMSRVKQDLAIARVTKAMKEDESSRFFIYCNRLGANGTDYISDEIDRITGSRPCVITSKVGKALTMEDINRSRVVVGSLASNEGISITGLRQVHIITPHWNISQTRQAIGRGTRFKVGSKPQPIKVYCYATYCEKKEANPSFSIDLYEYKRAFEKDRASNALLEKFTKLLPQEDATAAEVQVVDMFEDLMNHGKVQIIHVPEKKTESLIDLCHYKNIVTDRTKEWLLLSDNEIEVETNYQLYTSVPLHIMGKSSIFKRLYNMSFDELLASLENSMIDREFETTIFFKNSIIMRDNNVYHTFMYRKPAPRSYSRTYFMVNPQGLTKKLKQISSGKFVWIYCSEEEEKMIWLDVKERFYKTEESVEMYYSFSERKFKLKVSNIARKWDKRENARGKDINSYTTKELLYFYEHLVNNQLLYTVKAKPKFTKKSEIVNTIIWLFFDSERLKFF
ncbi:hypothetical protein GGF41_000395 [Coemansia sp. RSA 2531]|nr:hypothetical protein GGF41_000395 [Coemansia sp. RSA 2531]